MKAIISANDLKFAIDKIRVMDDDTLWRIFYGRVTFVATNGHFSVQMSGSTDAEIDIDDVQIVDPGCATVKYDDLRNISLPDGIVEISSDGKTVHVGDAVMDECYTESDSIFPAYSSCVYRGDAQNLLNAFAECQGMRDKGAIVSLELSGFYFDATAGKIVSTDGNQKTFADISNGICDLSEAKVTSGIFANSAVKIIKAIANGMIEVWFTNDEKHAYVIGNGFKIRTRLCAWTMF